MEWNSVSGNLSQISAGSSQIVWGVSADNNVYSRNFTDNRWTQHTDNMKHVSCAADGMVVYAIDVNNRIHEWQTDKFVQIDGVLAQISVGSAAHIWGVDEAGKIFYRDNNTWHSVAGGLSQISVGADGTVFGTISNKLYQRISGGWQQITGSFKHVSVGSARHVWAITTEGKVQRYLGSNRWEPVAGNNLVQVSLAGDGAVWAVDTSGRIFHTRYSAHGETPLAWTQVPGYVDQISVRSKDQMLAVRKRDGQVFNRQNGGSWALVAGAMQQVSVGDDGTLYGIDASDHVWHWQGDKFVKIPGILRELAVGSAEHLWGVQAPQAIYRRTGDSWTGVSGSLSQIAVGADGTVYGINANKNLYRRGDGRWYRLNGTFNRVAVASAEHIWAIASDGTLKRYLGEDKWEDLNGDFVDIDIASDGTALALDAGGNIFQCTFATEKATRIDWNQIPGLLSYVSVGAAEQVWGVNASQYVYTRGNARWNRMHSGMRTISAAADGTVYGTDAADKVWRLENGEFVEIPGVLRQVSVGSVEHIWGVEQNGQIYTRVGDAWTPVNGSLAHISVGDDGAVFGITSENHLYRRAKGKWQKVDDGEYSWVSVGSAYRVLVRTTDGQLKRYRGGTEWEPVTGDLVKFSVGSDGTLFGLDSHDQIFRGQLPGNADLFDDALHFDGSDDLLINIPGSVFASLDAEVTVEFWVNPDGDQDETVVFAATQTGDPAERTLLITLPWGNSIYWDTGAGSGFDRIAKAVGDDLLPGMWVHWAFVKNATTGEQKIYRNGELWFQDSGKTRKLDDIGQGSLGYDPHHDSNRWHGRVAQFRIWNVERTPDEIANARNLSLDKSAGLIFRLPAIPEAGISGKLDLDTDERLTFAGKDADTFELSGATFRTVRSQITIEFWAKAQLGLNEQTCMVIGGPTGADTDRTVCVHLPWKGMAYWDTGAGKGWDRINKTMTATDYGHNTWVHWAFVKNADTATSKIYRNGELWHQGTGQKRALDDIQWLRVGQYEPGKYHWRGDLTEMRIWDVERTQAEIQAGMSRHLAGREHLVFQRPERALSLAVRADDEYVRVPYNAALNPKTFTITCWAMVTGGQGTWRSPVTSRNSTGHIYRGFALYASPDNEWTLQVYRNGSSSNKISIVGPAVELDRWTHLAGTYDGTTARFYIDGVEVGNATAAYVANPDQPLYIGGSENEGVPALPMVGRVDEVSLWNIARTAGELDRSKSCQHNGREAGLVAYWSLHGHARDVSLNARYHGERRAGDWEAGRIMEPPPPPLAVPPAPPVERKVVHCDGRDDYIFLGDVATAKRLIPDKFTIEMWIKPESFTGWDGLASTCEYNKTVEKGWYLALNQGRPVFGLATVGADPGTGRVTRLIGKHALVLHRWQHIAAVYDGETMRLLIGGAPVASATGQSGAINYPERAEFVLGCFRDTNEFLPFHGAISDVRIGRVARTNDEIKGSMYTRLTGDEAGLSGYWPLDVGTGTVVYDHTGGRTHGRLINGAAWREIVDLPLDEPTERAERNQMLKLSGAGQYLSVPYSAELNPATFSVSCWVKMTKSSGYHTLVMSRKDSSNAHAGYNLYASSNGYWQFWIGNGSKWSVVGTQKAVLNRWTHIAGTYDGTTMDLYVNGEPAGSLATSLTVNPDTQLTIGSHHAGEQYQFGGLIDEVAIWAGARTQDQIKAEMANNLQGDEPGLRALWTIDNKDLSDQSGNGHHLSLHGDPRWVYDDTIVAERTEYAYAGRNVPVVPPAPVPVSELLAAGGGQQFSLYARLRQAIEQAQSDEGIALNADLLGPFSDISEAALGLIDVFIQVRNPVVRLVEGQPGILGEPGREIDPDNALVNEDYSKVELSGQVSIFNLPAIQMTAEFFTNKGKARTAIKFELPPSADPDQSPSFGLGSIFPDIPFISGLKFTWPTFIVTNDAILYDPAFDSGIDPGVNFLANFELQDADDDIWQFIGTLFQAERLGLHASVQRTNSGDMIYTAECAIRRNIKLIDGDDFKLTYTRADISISLSGVPPEPSVTIANDLVVSLRNFSSDTFDHLVFTGALKVETESVTSSLTLNGTGRSPAGALDGLTQNTEWREPFGITGVTIRQMAAQLGLTYTPPFIDNIGVVGNLKLGDIDGSIGVLVDLNDPDQFVLAGHTPRITIIQLMAVLTPPTLAAYQAVPDNLRNQLNRVVDVALEEVKVNIVPSATKIGQVLYRDEGFTVAGRLHVFGWQAEAFVNADYKDGITVRGSMDPIDVLGGLFQVRGARGAERAMLDIALRPDRFHLEVSALVSLLGISQEVYFLVDPDDGLYFLLKSRVGSLLHLDLRCIFADGQLACSGQLDFNVNLRIPPITIGPLEVGGIQLVDVSVGTTASLRITTAPSFELSFSGNFSAFGKSFRTGTITVRVAPSDFRNIHQFLLDHLVDKAGEIFASLFKDAWSYAKNLAEGVIHFTGDVIQVFKDVFGVAEDVAARLADVAGWGLNQIASSLKTVYNLGEVAVGRALEAVGFVGSQLAAGLQTAFGLSVEAGAVALKALDYSAKAVGQAIHDVWTTNERVAAAALYHAGFLADKAGDAIKAVFSDLASVGAEALYFAGYLADETGRVLKDIYGVIDSVAASAMKVAGYAMEAIGGTLMSVFNASAAAIASILEGLDYALEDVGLFLKDVGGFADTVINGALEGAGYAIGEVGEFMGDVFGGPWVPFVDLPAPFIDLPPPFINISPPFINISPPFIDISPPHVDLW